MRYFGTLGPACADLEALVGMFRAGMTGIRLNLSHGELEDHGHWLELFRQAATSCGAIPELLIDLKGPELRLGKLDGEGVTSAGDIVLLGDKGLPVPEIFLKCVKSGDHVLIDDGKLELLVLENREQKSEQKSEQRTEQKLEQETERKAEQKSNQKTVISKVLRGGVIKSGKSLAIVGKDLPMPTLTKSDIRNLRQAVQYGVTGVMLPFVRSCEDLITLRTALEDANAGEIKIFGKIENLQGVGALPELLPFMDYVVIARGDLGNAMPLWELPGIQKRISKVCREAGKPFMVVTQMLDSMHDCAVPTRAEVSDIYNAVCDGAEALMLTGETAVGKYPVEAMKYLVNSGEEALRDVGELRRVSMELERVSMDQEQGDIRLRF